MVREYGVIVAVCMTTSRGREGAARFSRTNDDNDLETNSDAAADGFPLDRGICALRQYRWEDRDDLIAQVNNRQIWRNMRDILPFPYTAADADAWLAKATTESPLLNCAITISDKVVGGIGLTLQSDVFRRTAEIGYWLGERSWGRGIGTAAVRAFTAYGFKNFDLQRIFAGVFAWNPASMRVLAKAGYWREGVMQHEVFKDGQIVDRVIYGITREAFLVEESRRSRQTRIQRFWSKFARPKNVI